MRQLGHEAREYLENLKDEFSLKRLFVNEREAKQEEEIPLSGGDIIKCRQYFLESSNTKNLCDFTESNLFELIHSMIGRELTNRQRIHLMKDFNTSTRGIRSRSIVRMGKNTFNCDEFCKFLCDKKSPDWTRGIGESLMLSRYSSRRNSLVS